MIEDWENKRIQMDLLIGGNANYFSVVIIIVKYRISWSKKLKTMFYLWSYFICFIVDAQFYPLHKYHTYHKSPFTRCLFMRLHNPPCMRFQKQNFVHPLLSYKTLSVVMLMFLSVLKSQSLSVGSSSKEKEALFTSQIYTFYHIHIWNLSICIHCNSGEHQFNFSAHFRSSFPT